MVHFIVILGWIGFTVATLISVGFLITSIIERRWRAVKISIPLFLSFLIIYLFILILDFSFKIGFIVILLSSATGFLTAFLYLNGKNKSLQIVGDQKRVDERDAIFHRFYRLKPGTRDFRTYYRTHPEKREFDDKVRALPLLGYPGSKSYHALSSPFSTATFDVIEKITRDVDWTPIPVESKPIKASAEEFSGRIKGFARYLGADLVGITRLNPAYIYSHIGRSPGKWGAPIQLKHPNAIAIAVEMQYPMLRHAPDSPTMTETAYKYFEAAKIGMVVSRYIHFLGYEARAHIDGNYRVMCGPVAADAGLGELGRLGLVITPRYGARIRLAVITTDLPLVYDEPVTFGVQDFCAICKKCAINCPSGAIDSGDKRIIRGVKKWQSDQESCYRFWRIQGSDCSLCIKVCPFSHPDTPLHNVVRWAVRRNNLARRLALSGDDLFYGRRPKTVFPPPDWHRKN